jgi:hypothetical protein
MSILLLKLKIVGALATGHLPMPASYHQAAASVDVIATEQAMHRHGRKIWRDWK